jgi:hypothetical protein
MMANGKKPNGAWIMHKSLQINAMYEMSGQKSQKTRLAVHLQEKPPKRFPGLSSAIDLRFV